MTHFLLLFAILVLTPALAVRGEPPGARPLSELLPSSDVRADVMEIQYPPRMYELGARYSQAAAANKEWFTAFVKKHQNESPLPYEEKLGLTEPEYREFLALGKQAKLQKKTEAQLLVTKSGEKVELRLDDVKNPLQPIAIDFQSKSLSTPLASVGLPTFRNAVERGGLLGARQSYTWEARSGTPESGEWSSVSFEVGLVSASNRKYIYYKVNKFAGGRPEIQFETILFY